MAYNHKNGQISIFKNEQKTEDKHPDYKGYGKAPNGAPIEIALWVKEGRNGKFFSGVVELKEQQAQTQQRDPAPPPLQTGGDQLPF